MVKKTLELGFLDGINKKFKISLLDPKEDLDKVNIESAMDIILDKNIFTSNTSDLVAKDEARIIETTTTIMDF